MKGLYPQGKTPPFHTSEGYSRVAWFIRGFKRVLALLFPLFLGYSGVSCQERSPPWGYTLGFCRKMRNTPITPFDQELTPLEILASLVQRGFLWRDCMTFWPVSPREEGYSWVDIPSCIPLVLEKR